MKSKLMRLLKDEEGQGMVEYGLIIGLVAVVAIGVIATMGQSILAFFTGANTAIDTATP